MRYVLICLLVLANAACDDSTDPRISPPELSVDTTMDASNQSLAVSATVLDWDGEWLGATITIDGITRPPPGEIHLVYTRVYDRTHLPTRQARLEDSVQYCTDGEADSLTHRSVRWEVKAWFASREVAPDLSSSGDTYQRGGFEVYCPKP